MTTRVRLFVTRSCEHKALSTSLSSLFASLIADIAAKLEVDNPCTGELAPETELKPNGVLRNA